MIQESSGFYTSTGYGAPENTEEMKHEGHVNKICRFCLNN